MATVRKGTKASAQDNFIGPNVVTGVTTTDVGTARAWNDGAVSVSWTNPTTGNTPTGYKVYEGATLKATISHPTNTATVGGYAAGASVTLSVSAYDSYGETAKVNGTAVTITTVPNAPAAPSVSSPTPSAAANTAGATQDSVSWSAPSNGGKTITNYEWTSSDGKSGTTASTSVTVNQEGGTSQTYAVRAYNDNGWSAYSANSGSVTTFSFTPFSFVPFGAFGFTPFGAFGFTPFGAFGFTPYGFSQGGGACIEADTLIRTSSGFVAAKDLNIGDKITSLNINEIPTLESAGDFNYVGFSSNTLTSEGLVEVDVVDIVASVKNQVICFNNEEDKKYSTTQPIFVKRNGFYEIIPTSTVEVGDILIKINVDGSMTETNVNSVDVIDSEHTVYQLSCEPQDWFIAGDYLVHNK